MINPADLLRLTARLRFQASSDIQNVFYMHYAGGSPISDDDAIDDMGEYLEGGYSELVSRLADDVTFLDYRVVNLTADVDLGYNPWPVLTAGTNVNDTLMPGVAGLIRALTSNPGHEARKFVGPFSEGNTLNGTYQAGLVTALGDAGDAWYSPFLSTLGNSWQPVVYDRETTQKRVPVSVVASGNPAYQRRRRVGTGT
jgi:hypothetical protein